MLKTLKNFLSYRAINIYAFLFIIMVLFIASYTQLHDHLEPCPLCVMQRVLFAILALLFLIGAIHVSGKRVRFGLHSLILLFVAIGVGVASRHVYLQHLPAGLAPSCGPGLNFMVKNLPPGEVLRMMLLGSGECAKTNWHFIGLSMPEWSLICFTFLGALNISQFFRK